MHGRGRLGLSEHGHGTRATIWKSIGELFAARSPKGLPSAPRRRFGAGLPSTLPRNARSKQPDKRGRWGTRSGFVTSQGTAKLANLGARGRRTGGGRSWRADRLPA